MDMTDEVFDDEEDEFEDDFEEDFEEDDDYDEDDEDDEDDEFDDEESEEPETLEGKSEETSEEDAKEESVAADAATGAVVAAQVVTEEEKLSAISPEEIPLSITVEVGRLKMSLQTLMDLKPGNLIELDVLPESGIDLVVNGSRVAKGELLQVGDNLGIRILELS